MLKKTLLLGLSLGLGLEYADVLLVQDRTGVDAARLTLDLSPTFAVGTEGNELVGTLRLLRGPDWGGAAGFAYRGYFGRDEVKTYFQGGFKLGPQAVSQAIWDTQGDLKPEKSRSLEAGYRIETGPIAASLAAYTVRFDNRLLQYNPCDSRQPVGPTCGNRFYNVGGVDSHGVELTFVWTPSDHLRWYNSASFNRSTYASDYVQAGVLQATKGKLQTDTPTKLFATQIDWLQGPWFASLRGKYTGKRYYTYTNDRGFGGFTVWDLSAGYDFGPVSIAKDVRLSLNVTNLGDKRYASNLDSSAFVPSDPAGTAYVFHASAPRQYFATATPNAANVAGALGEVEDTKFSVDRGYFTDPFQVARELQTDANYRCR